MRSALAAALIWLLGSWPAQKAVAVVVPGVYEPAPAGPFHAAKLSESQPASPYEPGGVAAVAKSHSASVLDDQWGLSCSQAPGADWGAGGMDEWGNGEFVMHYVLRGGSLQLGPGPWGEATGEVDSLVLTVHQEYRSGLLWEMWSEVRVAGRLEGAYFFQITDGRAFGFSTLGTDDPFPPLPGPACDLSAPRSHGEFFYLDHPVLTIQDSALPAVPATLGAVKAHYR